MPTCEVFAIGSRKVRTPFLRPDVKVMSARCGAASGSIRSAAQSAGADRDTCLCTIGT